MLTRGDHYHYHMIKQILHVGAWDQNPRPHWEDGEPAHSISLNHYMCTYDLANGETPIITLRPMAIKSAIKEILWIYQDQSNNLNLLKDKYGVTWWDEWDIGDRTIGCCYGETVRRHKLIDNLLEGIKKDPDGRRHIMSLWQNDDFKNPHGLKPCCYQTIFNVRHQNGRDYLDMVMIQRSADLITAQAINQVQYMCLLLMVANEFGYTPGQFTVFLDNVQIYDRHIDLAKELCKRYGEAAAKENDIEMPSIKLPTNLNKKFYNITLDDFEISYQREKIAEIHPQMKIPVAI